MENKWTHINGNRIHSTARIHPSIRLGTGNVIGPNVIIDGFKGVAPSINIGNNNIINDNVRILVEQFVMGDDNTIHNSVSILAGRVFMVNKCWIGQRAFLDGTGDLYMDSNVAVAYNSYIWTHADWKYLPEGSLLKRKKPVVIEYGVWMMGSNIVINPGVTVREKTVMLPNSVITKDTEPGCVYGGVPARKLDIEAWE